MGGPSQRSLDLPDPLLGELPLGDVPHLVPVVVAHLVTQGGAEFLAAGLAAPHEDGGLQGLARRHLHGERRDDGEGTTAGLGG